MVVAVAAGGLLVAALISVRQTAPPLAPAVGGGGKGGKGGSGGGSSFAAVLVGNGAGSWGKILYRGAGPWRGEEAIEGVYTYVVDVEFLDGYRVSRTGTVTLLR